MRISRWWPGITPFNVWRLTLSDWVLFAHACDEYTAQLEHASRDAAAPRSRR